jgi:hypothetical protein
LFCKPNFITSNPTGLQNPVYGDPKLGGKPPYCLNWNFGLQRTLSQHMTLGLTYTASMGKFINGPGSGDGSYNTAPLKYLALCSLLTAIANAANIATVKAQFPEIALPFPNFVGTIGQMLRPFPQYGTISTPMFSVGQSNYQGLQATLSRRYSNGFTFSAG